MNGKNARLAPSRLFVNNPSFLCDYVDRASLARELGISSRTIRRYEMEPDGLPYLIIGGRKQYRRDSVEKWLERRERHPNPTRKR